MFGNGKNAEDRRKERIEKAGSQKIRTGQIQTFPWRRCIMLVRRSSTCHTCRLYSVCISDERKYAGNRGGHHGAALQFYL